MAAVLEVRKTVQWVTTTLRENGQDVPGPHQVAIVAAVIANPYPSGYAAELTKVADELGAEIGRLLGPACVELLGGAVEAFGKAALVGIQGETEHGSALIHNLRFGNVFREAADGTELLPSAEKTALPGTWIDIPLKHKTEAKTRSHHQTVPFAIADAPLPREVVIACAAANRGRPLARLAEFGAELSAS